jgi:hypothetical protein
MGRLFAFLTPSLLAAIAIGLTASPALAEVCDKVLGESHDQLMHAGLWRYLLSELLSFPVLIGLGVAAITVADPAFGRWFSLPAGLGVGALAVMSIQENLFPHPIVDMARREGCGGAYWVAAILSTLVTLLLMSTFVWSFYRKPDQDH